MHACMRYVDGRAFDKLTTSDVGRDAMNRFIIFIRYCNYIYGYDTFAAGVEVNRHARTHNC